MWLDDCRTALYRLYDEAGTLLYIGISHDPRIRFEQHAREKPWWPQVARREIQWFDDRPSAARTEADAIRAEDPEHNSTYSRRIDRRYMADVVAADGVRNVSMTLARSRIPELVAYALMGGVAALVEYKARRVILVGADRYDQARQDEAVVEALKAVQPAVYARLLAEVS